LSGHEKRDDSAEDTDEGVEEDKTVDDKAEKALLEAFEAAKKAVEKALKSEKKTDIEEALALIEAVEDVEMQKELARLLGDLEIRPAAEMENEYFNFNISEVTDFDGNPYGENKPLKPNDPFLVKIRSEERRVGNEWNV